MIVVIRSPWSSGSILTSAFPRACGADKRQPPDLFLVDLAARGKEQHRRMGRGDEEPCDEILVARLHPGAALAAAPLRAIGRERNPFDIAKMRHGDDHVLALNEILVLDAAAHRRE